MFVLDGFLYTDVDKVPSSLRVMRTSKNAMLLFSSASRVNFTRGWMNFSLIWAFCLSYVTIRSHSVSPSLSLNLCLLSLLSVCIATDWWLSKISRNIWLYLIYIALVPSTKTIYSNLLSCACDDDQRQEIFGYISILLSEILYIAYNDTIKIWRNTVKQNLTVHSSRGGFLICSYFLEKNPGSFLISGFLI